MTIAVRIPKQVAQLTDWPSLANNQTVKFDGTNLVAATIGTASGLNSGSSSGNVPVLDESGKIPVSMLPSLALSEFLGTVATEAAMLALTGQEGDYCKRTDNGGVYILTDSDATIVGNWVVTEGGGSITSIDGLAGGSLTSGLTTDGTAQNLTISGINITAGGTDPDVQVKIAGKGNAGISLNGGNAVGSNSIALGASSTASGQSSIAAGQASTASGQSSIANGYASTASGDYSTASGYASTASGDYSTTIGSSSIAEGHYSIALGAGGNAVGNNSIALGASSTASGQSSIANGYSSVASGQYSTASGYASTASGDYSTASGYHSKANRDFQYSYAIDVTRQRSNLIGKANTTDATAADITAAISVNQTLSFVARVTGHRTDAAGTFFGTIVGCIENRSGATVLIGTPTLETHADTSGGTYAVAISADDTADTLVISVTGAAGHTIKWFVHIDCSEILTSV